MKNLPDSKQKELFNKIVAARKAGKATVYAATYGAKPATIARSAKVSFQEAEKLYDAYWKINWAILECANSLDVKTVNGQKWLRNPVSNLWYSLRHDKDKWSTLNQGTGVYCFDTWIKHFRKKRKQLTGQMHDEVILCVKQGNRDKAEKLLREAIKETNEELKLNILLDIDVQFGESYSGIH